MVFLILIGFVETWENDVESDSSRIIIFPLTNGIASEERKININFMCISCSLITLRKAKYIDPPN